MHNKDLIRANFSCRLHKVVGNPGGQQYSCQKEKSKYKENSSRGPNRNRHKGYIMASASKVASKDTNAS